MRDEEEGIPLRPPCSFSVTSVLQKNNSRVERKEFRDSSHPPRQTVRAVFPHTAFLYSSLQAIAWRFRRCISSDLSVHICRPISQRLVDHTSDCVFGSCGYSIDSISHTDTAVAFFCSLPNSLLLVYRNSLAIPLSTHSIPALQVSVPSVRSFLKSHVSFL